MKNMISMKNMRTSITINPGLLVEIRKIKGELQVKSDSKVTYEDVIDFLIKKYKVRKNE